MSFYWCLLKKKFEKIEGDLLAHVRQKQNTFLQSLDRWTDNKKQSGETFAEVNTNNLWQFYFYKYL